MQISDAISIAFFAISSEFKSVYLHKANAAAK